MSEPSNPKSMVENLSENEEGEKSVINLAPEVKKNQIEDSLNTISKKRNSATRWFYVWFALILFTCFYMIFKPFEIGEYSLSIPIFLLILSMLGTITMSGQSMNLEKENMKLTHELRIIDNEIFVNNISKLSQEERAIRRLDKSQADLEQYYSLNREQTKKIFRTGALLLLFGCAIIACTLAYSFLDYNAEKIVVVIAGFISGILIDFIGLIFISMYNKTIDSANFNQIGMLESSHVYLSNVLATQITDEELREKTLSEMSTTLIKKEKISSSFDNKNQK